jgi:2-octaprenyl-6-methoxyphenol hydroxylase
MSSNAAGPAGAGVEVDIAIAGGGMVGASLALALCGSGKRVLLVEAVAADAAEQPSFDDRTSALGNGSRRILETLGVWPQLAAHAGAVREIRVSHAGHFGGACLSAAEQGLAALGYVVPNRQLGAALWQQLAARPEIQVRRPARVQQVELRAQGVRLRLAATSPGAQPGVEAECLVGARLVVAADGAHSPVRAAAGISATVEDYRQVAVVVHVATDRPAAGTAYERFTPTGPLAILPLADGRYTVVWTLAPDHARQAQALDEAAFNAELQQAIGWRIGRITRSGARAAYPLQLSRADAMAGPRTVLVGNAAQALHPVAGQGFNLGLRDAALLAQILASAPDPGAAAVLEDFERRRAADRRGMIGFTDGLVRLFASERPGLALARNIGLQLFDLAPTAKRALSRISWGFGGEAPRLLRGLPATPVRPG